MYFFMFTKKKEKFSIVNILSPQSKIFVENPKFFVFFKKVNRMTETQLRQRTNAAETEIQIPANTIATAAAQRSDGYFNPYVYIMFKLLMVTFVIDIGAFIPAVISIPSKRTPMAILSIVFFCLSYIGMMCGAWFVWSMAKTYDPSRQQTPTPAPPTPAVTEQDMPLVVDHGKNRANWTIFINMYTHAVCMYTGIVVSLSIASLVT